MISKIWVVYFMVFVLVPPPPPPPTKSLYYLFMFVCNCVWSGLLYCFRDIEHLVFKYWTGFFWFITSLESLNHHSIITSLVPVCYPVDIIWVYGYNLTVFRFSKVNLLFPVSSLTKVILIKAILYPLCNLLSCHFNPWR